MKVGDKVKFHPELAAAWKSQFQTYRGINEFLNGTHFVINIKGSRRYRVVVVESPVWANLTPEGTWGADKSDFILVESAPPAPRVPCNCWWEPCITARQATQ